MKKYIGPVLSLASVAMLFYIIFHQKEQIKELKTSVHESTQKVQTVDSLHTVIDSLSSEVFTEHIRAERYEITLDRLRSEDSLTASIFEIYLNQSE
jgi:hemoglobin-like flavoprotein